jgi:predicted ABC-type ATPase
MPNLYIIAGPNGAGKTTASYTILPDLLTCDVFVNADEIARGLSPLNPEKASFEAGRLMLVQIKKNLSLKIDFAIETTLSTRSYLLLIRDAKKKGYSITLVFLWLKSIKVAKQRVKNRVREGGHSISEEVISRRYKRGLKNFKTFADKVDKWLLIDNSNTTPNLIAEKLKEDKCKIYKQDIYNRIYNL